jgi:hypothetical protein
MASKPTNEHDAWLKVFVAITDVIPGIPLVKCPNCGEVDIDFQYVGFEESRLGYMQIWCRSCCHGIYLSRVKAPEAASLILIDSPPEVIASRIPKIHEIQPG